MNTPPIKIQLRSLRERKNAPIFSPRSLRERENAPKKIFTTTSTQNRCISRPVHKSDPNPKSARTYTRVIGLMHGGGVGTLLMSLRFPLHQCSNPNTLSCLQKGTMCVTFCLVVVSSPPHANHTTGYILTQQQVSRPHDARRSVSCDGLRRMRGSCDCWVDFGVPMCGGLDACGAH